MEKRKLGNSDLEITPIGFGAWAIGGGDWVFGWGPQDDAESIATIEHAVKSGINWVDTAAVYGLGHSEEIVAKALKNIGPSERPYVFTKCSLVWGDDRVPKHDLDPASIRREIEQSLSRLNTDIIDLYQIHWPRWSPELPDDGIEDAWETLADLKKEGKVRWIGVSNFDTAQLERISKLAVPTSLQPPYSAIRRDVEAENLPYCEKNNIGVIVYSPMQSGMLTGKMTRERISAFPADDWRSKSAQYQEPLLTKNLAFADLFIEIGRRHAVSAGVVAIAWTLRLSAVTGAIVGARRPEQIDGIIEAGDFRLSDNEIAEIEKTTTKAVGESA